MKCTKPLAALSLTVAALSPAVALVGAATPASASTSVASFCTTNPALPTAPKLTLPPTMATIKATISYATASSATLNALSKQAPNAKMAKDLTTLASDVSSIIAPLNDEASVLTQLAAKKITKAAADARISADDAQVTKDIAKIDPDTKAFAADFTSVCAPYVNQKVANQTAFQVSQNAVVMAAMNNMAVGPKDIVNATHEATGVTVVTNIKAVGSGGVAKFQVKVNGKQYFACVSEPKAVSGTPTSVSC